MKKNDQSLFEALQAFDALTQAVAFSSNEHALLFALLRTWNAARRPAVIEQWADTTCRNAGLTKDTMPNARNHLIQKGVIFYDKKGNRSVPRYSLNALLNLDSPFLPREKRSNLPREKRSKSPSKQRVSDEVNGVSYQDKEKTKESPLTPKGEWDGVFPSGCFQRSKGDQKKIKVLRNNDKMTFIGTWFGRKPETLWNVYEARSLKDIAPPKEEVLIMKSFLETDYEFHRGSIETMLNNWTKDLDKARKQESKKKGKSDKILTIDML